MKEPQARCNGQDVPFSSAPTEWLVEFTLIGGYAVDDTEEDVVFARQYAALLLSER